MLRLMTTAPPVHDQLSAANRSQSTISYVDKPIYGHCAVSKLESLYHAHIINLT